MKLTFAAAAVLLTASSGLAQQLPSVTSFSLLRADTGAVLIADLSDGAAVDLSALPTTKLTIRANTAPSIVRKVVFTLDAEAPFTDNAPPYALRGDDGGNYVTWTPAVKSYTLVATPYDRETAVAGASARLRFSFTVGAQPTPTPAPSATPVPSSTPAPTPTTTATPKPTSVGTASPTPVPTQVPTAQPTPGTSSRGPLAVFPGAQGFGTLTTGGSGRHLTPPSASIFRVRSLADKGAGTLRECVEASVPRTCIFEISGRIMLQSDLRARSPYLTIAGQTAPPPGILLSGGSLRLESHDILVQHLQIRPGDASSGPAPGSRDGISVIGTVDRPAYNIVLDHLTLSWSVDENFSTYGTNVNDVTLSRSLIAEALHRSRHPEGPHSMGALIGEFSERISLHHNLFAHNHDRNPRMKYATKVEVVSNVIYNWGGTSGWNVANLADSPATGLPVQLNFIGNHFKRGPDSTPVASIYASPVAPSSRVYVLSNIGPTRTTETAPEWSITKLDEGRHRSLSPVFPLSGVVPHSGPDTFDAVLRQAGSRPREGSSPDDRVRNEVRTGTGRIKDCVAGCSLSAGGWPILTSRVVDHVLPDRPFDDPDGNGYTALEDWIFEQSRAVE